MNAEPFYGHQFKEVRQGVWRCECGKQLIEGDAPCMNGTPNISKPQRDAGAQADTQTHADGLAAHGEPDLSTKAESCHADLVEALAQPSPPEQVERAACGCTEFEQSHCRAGIVAEAHHPDCVKVERAGLVDSQPIETIEYWADAYTNPAKGDMHFHGHGMVAKLLTEYAQLRKALAPQPAQPARVVGTVTGYQSANSLQQWQFSPSPDAAGLENQRFDVALFTPTAAPTLDHSPGNMAQPIHDPAVTTPREVLVGESPVDRIVEPAQEQPKCEEGRECEAPDVCKSVGGCMRD